MATPPLLEKARTQAETAHHRLCEALLSGEDTTAARRALIEAEARLAELSRESTRTGPDPEIEAAIQAEAAALVAETAEAIAARVNAFSPYPRPEPVELPLSLAVALVRARHQHALVEADLTEHRAKEQRIQTRLDDLAARRAGLMARRLDGDERPEDAAELALIEADARALEQMLAAHRATRPTEPRHDLHHREAHWRQTCNEAEGHALRALAERLQQHTITLAERLVDFNREIRVAPGGIGYRMRVEARWREAAGQGVW
ncbi:hypothetical protein [Allochromatium vinosum]|uniref:Uncharacterized protein n=1 Tax=Allochromatium vinosum (strain ATCC 17899 / DSM 180 / NBRC 103801 / NCIMB 10441 / D) TaxID=572477 RepID=D3RTY2_ALLVD|nr:hypothetical protein [Allochromatium vinosum]ADC62641.1 hypothetical protein Alvin_1709 [Allochromatium vinosum DSM 180]